jgi:alpha-glucoside transport system substrate-binding protein
MKSRSARIFASVIVILTLVLAGCSSGGANNQATGTAQVPATGATATTSAGGAGAATSVTTETTSAGGSTTETPATTSVATGTSSATGSTTETPSATGAATGTTSATAAATGQATTGAGPAAQVTPWKGQQIGGTVHVLAVWGGAELADFNAMVKPFTDQTGISVQVESTRDLTGTLNTQIKGGNPPDLAGIPNPGALQQLVSQNALKPLNDVLDMNAMGQQYDPGLLKLAQVNGQQYGIFTKASVKSLVWYDPQVWQKNGWEPPKTWQDLQALEQKMQATNVTPWCVGLDGGGGSVWPATDWIEDIYLHQAGPDAYDKLFPTHGTAWTDPAVKQAWQTFGSIVTDQKMTYGGATTALATAFGSAFNPMFNTDKPSCYMLHGADFMTTFFTQNFPNLKAGTDYNFFVFPSENPQYAGDLEVAGDLFGMFKDTPQARALMQYLVTPDAQSIWAGKGGYLAPNKAVDPSVYPDDMTRNLYKLYVAAQTVRFDGSDQMPPAVGTAFDQAIRQYLTDPTSLDAQLQAMETAAKSGYSK